MSFQDIKKIGDIKEIIEYANLEIDNYTHALLFSLDGVFLNKEEVKKKIEEMKTNLEKKTFIEARFFDDKKELFVFYDGENYKAVETDKDKWDKDRICRPYILDSKFQEKDYIKNNNIKHIRVIEFIDYDEDGQAYVKASCLDGVVNE